jgi:hypothetical protein
MQIELIVLFANNRCNLTTCLLLSLRGLGNNKKKNNNHVVLMNQIIQSLLHC